MMYFRIICILSAIIWVDGAASDSAVNISEQVRKVFPSVVRIKVQHSTVMPEESELVSTDLGGSGFVLDNDHHIVTNAHVINDAKRIVVVDVNDTEYPATLVAKDDKSDIAVLNAGSFNAPSSFLGNSSILSAGDGIFLLGSPYSLGSSVSVGVVSAMKRFLPNYPYLHFIQTDAAINPGNSGGPAFNLNGELIGMVSTYFSRQGGYTNIGFIIPIEDIQRITRQLLSNQKVMRGYFGADLLISEKLSRKMGYQSSIMIARTYSQGPAEQSGLKAGDMIIGLNGEYFRDSGMLHRFLEKSLPDQNASITYVRSKKLFTTNIRLTNPPDKEKIISNAGTGDQAEKLGLILRENEGLIVLLSYATAQNVGIDPQDKITHINGCAIKNISDLNAQLIKLKENDIAMISILRNKETFVLPIGPAKGFKVYSNEN